MVSGELAVWVETHLAAHRPQSAVNGGGAQGPAHGVRAAGRDWSDLPRRVHYGRIKELWKRDHSAAVSDILAGGSMEPLHDAVELGRYWKPVMEEESAPWPNVSVRGLWYPLVSIFGSLFLWTRLVPPDHDGGMCPSGVSQSQGHHVAEGP